MYFTLILLVSLCGIIGIRFVDTDITNLTTILESLRIVHYLNLGHIFLILIVQIDFLILDLKYRSRRVKYKICFGV